MPDIWLWIGFNAFILLMLALDLGVFHRRSEVISVKESVVWSVLWVVVALAFNFGIYQLKGAASGAEFLTGYLIERALSMDNIFVFLLLFSFFRIPAAYQHKVLFWGIIGALIMRGAMIGAGTYLIHHFHWLIYLFGAFLLVTGARMLMTDEEPEPQKNPLVRWIWARVPVTSELHEDKFFVRMPEHPLSQFGWVATPLFLVLLTVEVSDLIFAVDSIPAIFAITDDPFIIYTSNVFAILGLRAMYFLLAGIMDKFQYLRHGLSIVLLFVGTKMLIVDFFHIPVMLSLAVVAGILALSIILSIALAPPRQHGKTNFFGEDEHPEKELPDTVSSPMS